MNKVHIPKKIYLPVIKTFVTLFILWGLGDILKALPMLEELSLSKVSFTVPDIVNMLIASLMVVVLLNFTQEIRYQLERSATRLPESSTLVVSLVFTIAVLIVYKAFSPLGLFFLEGSFWIYQVGFFVLFLIPIGFAGSVLYSNTDTIIDIITGETKKTITNEDQVACQECGTVNIEKAKYCISCGAEIILPKEEPTSKQCQECGADNDLRAKFCFQCGLELITPIGEDIDVNICSSCGEENEPDAGFCIECGSSLT